MLHRLLRDCSDSSKLSMLKPLDVAGSTTLFAEYGGNVALCKSARYGILAS